VRLRWTPLVGLLAAATLDAQTFRGGIRGTVSDPTNAALPGVTITAAQVGTGLTRTSATDEAGTYAFSELPLGEWNVAATLTGFSSGIAKGVHVETSSVRRVDFVLSAGGRSESVDVVAKSALVDSTGNTQGGTIDGREAAELPINGRDFTKLLSMVPGTAADPSSINDSPGSFGLFSANGNRGRSNNYLLDGTDMNDGYRNLPAINQGGVFGTPSTILPVDAIEEFPILSGVEAEYGRNAGAIVNIVTRSGSNELHGALFEYFRDEALGARNYFNAKPQAKNQFSNHQFGASLGGPLVKDRTFFFLAYEGQREDGGIPGPFHVPTAGELADSIAQNGGSVNPVSAGLLARQPWPAPNQAPDEAGNNLQATTPFANNVDNLIAKLDHHFAKSDLFTLRYFYGTSEQSFPFALGSGGLLPGFNTVTPTTVHLVSASLTHVVSPKLLVELRAGYNRFHEDFFPEDNGFDPNSIGLATVSDPQDFGLPQISVGDYATLGGNNYLPRGRVDTNWQGFANVSYSASGHRVKLGYEFRRTHVDQYFNAGYRGVLNFDSLDDFVAGRVSGGRQARGDSNRETFQNNHGLYFQDNFQLSRRLALNYGLRWDYYGVLGEAEDRLSRFDTASGRVVRADPLYDKDWNNFAPRVSAVYDLTGEGRTLLRAGWGLYYDAFSQDFFVGQIPWDTFNPGVAYNEGVDFSFSPTDTLVPGAPVFSDFSASDVWSVDPKLRTPYVQNYNVNLQHQLGAHAALQLGYVGSAGRKLFRFRAINQADPATGERPYPDFFYVNQFESSASSSYNSLQASLRVSRFKGLTSTLNYNWSHSIDTASDGQDYVPHAAQPDDSRAPGRERADSNFDVRHRLVWYFSWELGGSTGNALRSGWSLNGIVTLASGMPFGVVYLYEDDYNGSGQYFGRPDIVGDPLAGTATPDRFLSLAAFQAPCSPNGEGGCAGGQHFGSLGRNAFDGPGYQNVDLSVVKDTRLGARLRLQLRVDVFNVFNHPNFANPLLPNYAVDFLQNGIDPETNRGIGHLPLTATVDVGGGNPFLGGGGPRTFQLAARLSF
jgi:Carboxypeptidase regulatory-like domain/TonB dependent receptor/TonB-dependent Receptor Plug Domain